MAIVVSYALGQVPGSRIVARHHGVDLDSVGDGNPGAWNALEQLGWRRAWPAFAIDGAKGLLAAVVGWVALGTPPLGSAAGGLASWLPWSGAAAAEPTAWVAWACVGAAMLGHAFPIAQRGRGGKSVMTFVGGAFGLVPVAAVPLALAFGAAVLVRRTGRSRRATIGARVVVAAFPFAQGLVTPLVQVGWTGVLMTMIGALFLVRGRRAMPPVPSPR